MGASSAGSFNEGGRDCNSKLGYIPPRQCARTVGKYRGVLQMRGHATLWDFARAPGPTGTQYLC